MRARLAAIMFSILACPGVANARLTDVTGMTCQQAAAVVASQGSAVVIYDHHPAAGPLYKRFYAAPIYCPAFTRFRNASARTTDSANCIIGGSCREIDRDRLMGHFMFFD